MKNFFKSRLIQATIVAGVFGLLYIILEITFSPSTDDEVYNVSSSEQSGGVTAGKIEVLNYLGTPPVLFTDEDKDLLISEIVDISPKFIRVKSVDDSISSDLAEQILTFLLSEGLDARGVDIIFTANMNKGVHLLTGGLSGCDEENMCVVVGYVK